MALLPDSFVSPKGPLTTVLFPDTELRDLLVKLGGFIELAGADARVAAQTDPGLTDRLTRAYVLGTAYDEVTQRMIAEPLTVNVGAEKGSHGYSAKQIEMMAALAAKYWKEFDVLLGSGEVVSSQSRMPTLFIPTETGW